jgi:FkbH-like protein
MDSFLQSLEMVLQWQNFGHVGLQRIVQLINKTNQFNLTTRRYTEEDIRTIIGDEHSLGLQLRLLDRFGDNGIIGVVIGRHEANNLVLDTWLMSCRVLGRQVEEATLNIIATEAKKLSAENLIGLYRPTAKNNMVRDHYPRLGFMPLEETEDGGVAYSMPLNLFSVVQTPIRIERV